MLSQEERQELAENAMEELASGLNRAAQAMKVGGNVDSVADPDPVPWEVYGSGSMVRINNEISSLVV